MYITKELLITLLTVAGGIAITFTLRFLIKKSKKDSNNKNAINQISNGNGVHNQAGRDINVK